MALSTEQRLQQIIGAQVIQITMLQVELERMKDELEKAKAQVVEKPQ